MVDPETIATLTISRVLDERSERFEVVVTDIRAHTLSSTPNRTRAHINTRTHTHTYTHAHTRTLITNPKLKADLELIVDSTTFSLTIP